MKSTHVRNHKRRKRSGGTTDVCDHDRSLKDRERPRPLDPRRKKPDEEKERRRLEKAIGSLDLPPNMDMEIRVFDFSRTSNKIVLELLIDGKPLVSGYGKYLNIHYETVPSNVPGVFSFNSVDEAIAFLNTSQGEFDVDVAKVQKAVHHIREQGLRSAYRLFSDTEIEPGDSASGLDVPYWILETKGGGKRFQEDYYRWAVGPSNAYLPYADVPVPEDGFLVHVASHDGEQEVDLEEEWQYVGEGLNEIEKEMAKQQLVTHDDRLAMIRYQIAMGVYVDGPKAVEEVKSLMEDGGAAKDEAIQNFVSGLEGGEADYSKSDLEEYLRKNVKSK